MNKYDTNFQKMYSRGGSKIDSEKLANLEEEIKKQSFDSQQFEQQINSVLNNYTDVNSKVKGIQRQEDSELMQLRNALQERLNDEHKSQLKNKEKSQVLFGEVVRLGELHEKKNEFLRICLQRLKKGGSKC